MTETTLTLDRREVLRKSEEQLEPAWLRTLRRKAVDLYEKQPWPDRTDENWRFTDYRRLLPESFGGQPETAGAAVPEVDELEQVLRGGRLVQLGSVPEHADANLRIASLADAARSGERGVRQSLEEAVAHAVDRFDSLALATFDDGFFVRVGDGASLKELLTLRFRPRVAENGWGSTFSHIALGARSTGVLVVDFASSGENEDATCGADHLRVEIGDGARWRILVLQRLGEVDSRLHRIRFALGNAVGLQVFRLDWGGATVKSEVSVALRGEGSDVRWRGAYLLGGTQRFELDTLQDHVAGGDASDLFVKGVLGQRARAVYRGLIWIHPNAQRSNAYQSNRNLLLSDSSHVHSIPMLEIEANDVRCSHGSASGPIDPDQIFYLQSRGLPEQVARRMIINGFVSDLLTKDGVPEQFRSALERLIEVRVDQLVQG